MIDFSRYQHILQTKVSVADRLLQQNNVVGVGVGFKTRAGQVSDEMCISVSVADKVSASRLPASQTIPPAVDDVETDVVHTGPILAHSAINRRAAMRPARPGVSIGHYETTAGTMGLVVRRDGQTYILSNNHVLARVNQARIGDPIYQPGPADGGSASSKIAELVDFIPLRLPTAAPPPPTGFVALIASLIRMLTGQPEPPPPAPDYPPNQVDVALARPLDPALIQPLILDIGLPKGVAEPMLGTRVRKSGRTTGLTSSTIQQVDVTANIIYAGKSIRFVNQIMTGPMSRPGDSGSPVVDDQNHVVGLMFSGSDFVTLCNPIAYITAALNCEVVVA